MGAYLIGHLDKFVGGLTHRRNDRYDTITTAMRTGEAARDRANFCWCLKTGTAVFLHDDGIVAHPTYRNTLRAPYMLARTNCERLDPIHQRPNACASGKDQGLSLIKGWIRCVSMLAHWSRYTPNQ